MVLLAAAPVDSLFVHSGGEEERDWQLLDDLGLSGVKRALAAALHDKIRTAETPRSTTLMRSCNKLCCINVK